MFNTLRSPSLPLRSGPALWSELRRWAIVGTDIIPTRQQKARNEGLRGLMMGGRVRAAAAQDTGRVETTFYRCRYREPNRP